MTQPTLIVQSPELRNPSPDTTDEGQKIYIALLERRLLYFALRDMKMRACLELATGVPYDATDFSKLSYDDMAELIAQDMTRGLNISIQEARTRVAENKIMSNPDES